ncbi:MAG: hypothetical protein M1814_006884 [Vezdaea aestivalis]|nr:MAG: hypothetical protein M1814_006884 [Vezdaea aestivalis]
MSTSELIPFPTDAELFAFCAHPPEECILCNAPYGNKVIRISSQAVVKFGVGVTRIEAENQSKVYELVDHRIVRIPKVHRFINDNENRGYIIMDFVDGEVLEELEEPQRIATIAYILDHLASFNRTVPGPVAGGSPYGLLFFPDEGEAPFNTVEELEYWWNHRLLPGETAAELQGIELVLCHLDVAPRNIIWKEGEAPCLIDWASTGYYPRLFEFCVQSIVEDRDGRFHILLLNAMTELRSLEARQIKPVLQAWSNMQRYHFTPTWSKITALQPASGT